MTDPTSSTGSPGQLPDFSGFQQTGQRIQDSVPPLQDAASELIDEAMPGEPESHPEPGSPADLESQLFLRRTLEYSGFNPTTPGLSFNINAGAGLGDVSTRTLLEDIETGTNMPEDSNPLTNPLLRDYNLGANGSLDMRYTLPNGRFYYGLRGDASAAVSTNGVNQNISTFADLYEQGQQIEEQFGQLEERLESITSQLENNEQFQRLEEIAGDLQGITEFSDLTPDDWAKITEAQQIMGDLSDTLGELESALGDINQLMGDANDALGALGDGTRTVSANAATRGALEFYAGMRSERYQLGQSSWGATFHGEAALIHPIRNPITTPSDFGLPQFQTLMTRVSARAQVTVSGLSDIQNRISSLQNNVSSLQEAAGNAQDQVDTLGNPITYLDQDQTNEAFESLGSAVEQANDSGEALASDLEGLTSDLESVQISTELGITTVEATAPLGLGLRELGVTLDGSIAPWLDARLQFQGLNLVGVLEGETNYYHLEQNQDGDMELQLDGTETGNVFHDFYDPTLAMGVGLTANRGEWYQTDVYGRVEQSLSSDTTRVSGLARQHLGRFTMTGGIMNPNVQAGHQANMYVLGLGVENILNVNVATDSFHDPSALQTNIDIHIPTTQVHMGVGATPIGQDQRVMTTIQGTF